MDGSRRRLAAVGALVRADERDRIARDVEALDAIDGLWAPTYIARRIRREDAVPVKPEMTTRDR